MLSYKREESIIDFELLEFTNNKMKLNLGDCINFLRNVETERYKFNYFVFSIL